MTATRERFANKHEEAQHWLCILKDGPNHQRVQARLGLARLHAAQAAPS